HISKLWGRSCWAPPRRCSPKHVAGNEAASRYTVNTARYPSQQKGGRVRGRRERHEDDPTQGRLSLRATARSHVEDYCRGRTADAHTPCAYVVSRDLCRRDGPDRTRIAKLQFRHEEERMTDGCRGTHSVADSCSPPC